MKLEIQDTIKIREIKDIFNHAFPYLKIEFFTRQHAPGEATSIDNLVHGNQSLGEINSYVKKGSMLIQPDDTVASVEQSFQEKFGLAIQVFRKQKESWIETTKTDHLTLSQQNEKGKEACMPAIHTEPGDRYLEDGQY